MPIVLDQVTIDIMKLHIPGFAVLLSLAVLSWVTPAFAAYSTNPCVALEQLKFEMEVVGSNIANAENTHTEEGGLIGVS